jgi:thiol-disulfide isomerase/thioredoxin
MRLRSALIVLTALALAVVSLAQSTVSTSLLIGDPAPKITVSKWVKGTPVENFEKGKIYVVEFWATWCVPCKESIPHLTGLAKKYAGKVDFVGVSSFEADQKLVKPYVDTMGNKMAYNVAMDQVPDGDDHGQHGAMAQMWMEASGQDAIPTAFIIDKDTNIAWIGRPLDMDSALSKVVGGAYGPDDYAKAKLAQQHDMKVANYQAQMSKAMAAKDEPGVMAILDQMIADSDIDIQTQGGITKFQILLAGKNFDDAYTLGKTLMDGPLKANSDALNTLAWDIVDPAAKIESKDLDLAMAAAQKSVDLDKHSAHLDTGGRVYCD